MGVTFKVFLCLKEIEMFFKKAPEIKIEINIEPSSGAILVISPEDIKKSVEAAVEASIEQHKDWENHNE